MRINIFGLGYVGCISAGCLTKNDHKVTEIDINPVKVNRINEGISPIVEEGLGQTIYKFIRQIILMEN